MWEAPTDCISEEPTNTVWQTGRERWNCFTIFRRQFGMLVIFVCSYIYQIEQQSLNNIALVDDMRTVMRDMPVKRQIMTV